MKILSFKSPSAWIPIAMSLLALVTIAWSIVVSGAAREADEGAAAHLWQVLVVGQVPFVAWFMAKRARRDLRQGAVILAAQLGAVLAAVAPVYFLGL